VLDGCSRGSRRWERLQDELVERAADIDRLTHHDAVDQEQLDGLLDARWAESADGRPRRGLAARGTRDRGGRSR
jgi:hypothetical protein